MGERSERPDMESCERASMISLGWGFLACNALAMDGKHLGANGDTCITGEGDERACMKLDPRGVPRGRRRARSIPGEYAEDDERRGIRHDQRK